MGCQAEEEKGEGFKFAGGGGGGGREVGRAEEEGAEPGEDAVDDEKLGDCGTEGGVVVVTRGGGGGEVVVVVWW